MAPPAAEDVPGVRQDSYAHVFSPINLGPMRLRNRIVVPPHGSAIGDLWATSAQAE